MVASLRGVASLRVEAFPRVEEVAYHHVVASDQVYVVVVLLEVAASGQDRYLRVQNLVPKNEIQVSNYS